jgi:hypothetical protein
MHATAPHPCPQLYSIKPAVGGRQQQVWVPAQSGAKEATAFMLQACMLCRDVAALQLQVCVGCAANDQHGLGHWQAAAVGQDERDRRPGRRRCRQRPQRHCYCTAC